MVESARRGRPPRISRDDIARTVLDVGFNELTFAAVRDRLGIGESTLYRHAPDRDALVRIGLEQALADVAWPALAGPWRPMLESYAHAAWQALAAHPGSATEVARGVVPAAMAALFVDVSAALMRAGFTAEHAVLSSDLVFDLVADNRRATEHLDELVSSAGPGRARISADWFVDEPESASGTSGQSDAESVSPRLAPERAALRESVQAAIVSEPLAWFVAKLDVVLAGITATLAPQSADT